jgi:hypothetical protein
VTPTQIRSPQKTVPTTPIRQGIFLFMHTNFVLARSDVLVCFVVVFFGLVFIIYFGFLQLFGGILEIPKLSFTSPEKFTFVDVQADGSSSFIAPILNV